MNRYLFGFLLEPTTAPVVGDASALQRMCKQIGYLAFGGKSKMTVGGRLTITTGAYVATNATTGNPAVELSIESPYRLPSTLMPPNMGATTSGEVVTAGAGIFAATVALDDKKTTVLTGLDRPVVTKGCGIVAYLPASTDVSEQLDEMISIPVCNGQTIVIGTAIQDALDGIYATPFSTAWAYGIFGGRQATPVAVVPVNTGNANFRSNRLAK